MAASKQPLGVDHPTIVPTNFEEETETSSDTEESMARADE